LVGATGSPVRNLGSGKASTRGSTDEHGARGLPVQNGTALRSAQPLCCLSVSERPAIPPRTQSYIRGRLGEISPVDASGTSHETPAAPRTKVRSSSPGEIPACRDIGMVGGSNGKHQPFRHAVSNRTPDAVTDPCRRPDVAPRRGRWRRIWNRHLLRKRRSHPAAPARRRSAARGRRDNSQLSPRALFEFRYETATLT
jgi:hypothetical protein